MKTVCHLPPYRVDAVAYAAPSSGVDWHLSAYGLPSLWATAQGEGVQVAILDTGVDPSHPALHGALVDHRNFTNDCSPYDTNGHGTHVAAIVCARGPLTGVAPQARVLSCKVLGNDGAGSMESVARAVTFAAEHGVHVIVMSLGAPIGNGKLERAILAAVNDGVPVVCAAGNDGGRVSFPAAYGDTIAVGAVDQMGGICEFSCRGREIDVAAPGWQIRSAWLNGGYATLSGTSMAAPFVAGVLALATSQRGGERLGREAKAMLQQTSTDVGVPGRDNEYGWGLVSPSSVIDLAVRAIL